MAGKRKRTRCQPRGRNGIGDRGRIPKGQWPRFEMQAYDCEASDLRADSTRHERPREWSSVKYLVCGGLVL